MRMSARLTTLGLATLLTPVGCAINAEPDFDSAVPQERFLAIREAMASRDTSALPDLVRQLGSDDPLVRVAAIDALESITGDRLGFEPHAREVERRAAIDRWTERLSGQRQAEREGTK